MEITQQIFTALRELPTWKLALFSASCAGRAISIFKDVGRDEEIEMLGKAIEFVWSSALGGDTVTDKHNLKNALNSLLGEKYPELDTNLADDMTIMYSIVLHSLSVVLDADPYKAGKHVAGLTMDLLGGFDDYPLKGVGESRQGKNQDYPSLVKAEAEAQLSTINLLKTVDEPNNGLVQEIKRIGEGVTKLLDLRKPILMSQRYLFS